MVEPLDVMAGGGCAGLCALFEASLSVSAVSKQQLGLRPEEGMFSAALAGGSAGRI